MIPDTNLTRVASLVPNAFRDFDNQHSPNVIAGEWAVICHGIGPRLWVMSRDYGDEIKNVLGLPMEYPVDFSC